MLLSFQRVLHVFSLYEMVLKCDIPNKVLKGVLYLVIFPWAQTLNCKLGPLRLSTSL